MWPLLSLLVLLLVKVLGSFRGTSLLSALQQHRASSRDDDLQQLLPSHNACFTDGSYNILSTPKLEEYYPSYSSYTFMGNPSKATLVLRVTIYSVYSVKLS